MVLHEVLLQSRRPARRERAELSLEQKAGQRYFYKDSYTGRARATAPIQSLFCRVDTYRGPFRWTASGTFAQPSASPGTLKPCRGMRRPSPRAFKTASFCVQMA